MVDKPQERPDLCKCCGIKLSIAWFKDRINHHAKLLGIQKGIKYYDISSLE